MSIANDPGRGGFGGPVLIYDRNGILTERRHETFNSEYDRANFQAKLGLDGPGTSVGNLTLAYVPYWNPTRIRDRREFVTGEERSRTNRVKLDGYFADINADYAFGIGPGRLKLIGVRHWDHEPLLVTQILNFDSSGADPEGIRFARDTRVGETIGRAEYGWKSGRNDWQISLERAYNSLDQKGGLFELSPDGEFEEIAFPEGTGKVTETRYEAIATLSRPLASNLNLQIAGGGEISKLDARRRRSAGAQILSPQRQRDLGLAAGEGLGHQPQGAPPRRPDQLLRFPRPAAAQRRPRECRQSRSGPAAKLGGGNRGRARSRRVGQDPAQGFIITRSRTSSMSSRSANHGEGIGNLPRATRFGIESVSTINFDPIGWKGAKLDMTVGREWTAVRDPLTGDKRQICGVRSKWLSLQVRHDIPGTELAWSAYRDYGHYAKYYYLTEVFRSWEGPWFVGVYVEHKNVAGLTVRLGVDNILNGRHSFTRTIYAGYRDSAPISFIQKQNQLIGPIFSFR